jgi:hypothetical protein
MYNHHSAQTPAIKLVDDNRIQVGVDMWLRASKRTY